MLTERSVEIPWLISRIGRPERILDIGSADAVYVNLLYELCRDLYLCDTRQFTPTVPAAVFIGSASKLPDVWTAHFDLVTCISVLDHVGLDAYGNSTDPNLVDDVMTEIERVLRPGGRLLLTVPFGRYLETRHPGGGQRVFDWETLFGLFPDATWNVVDVSLWRLSSDRTHYVECAKADVADAGYDEWRAEACIALEMVRKP